MSLIFEEFTALDKSNLKKKKEKRRGQFLKPYICADMSMNCTTTTKLIYNKCNVNGKFK